MFPTFPVSIPANYDYRCCIVLKVHSHLSQRGQMGTGQRGVPIIREFSLMSGTKGIQTEMPPTGFANKLNRLWLWRMWYLGCHQSA